MLAIVFFALLRPRFHTRPDFSGTLSFNSGEPGSAACHAFFPDPFIVGNVIFMNDRKSAGASEKASLRDRRYAIRYPFAADAEVLDLESGARAEGVTSDISLGGCFVCTSKPLPIKSRARVTLVRKDETVQALAMVRIVKPRIGMGLEFIDVEPSTTATLARWLDQLRRDR
jgi:hypothetical protein